MEGCADWLRDVAAAYRADAANLVGGMRNRMFAEADDCDRWADALDAAMTNRVENDTRTQHDDGEGA